MKNIDSTDGAAEDLIRSMIQLACLEQHYKTLLEKRMSEMENGLIEEEKETEHSEKIDNLQEDLEYTASIRRNLMRNLYDMYNGKGDKERWCMVKHWSIAMYTAFEAYQASENDPELFLQYYEMNKMLLKELSAFLGVEITECAACFADALKGV